MVSEFLKLLNMELQMTDTNSDVAPRDKIKNSDHVVSNNVPDDIKKLWVLSSMMMESVATKWVKYHFTRNIDEDQARELSAMKSKSDVVRELFWIALKDHFDLWAKGSVGIRAGWTVVCNDRPQDDDVFKFLKELME